MNKYLEDRIRKCMNKYLVIREEGSKEELADIIDDLNFLFSKIK